MSAWFCSGGRFRWLCKAQTMLSEKQKSELGGRGRVFGHETTLSVPRPVDSFQLPNEKVLSLPCWGLEMLTERDEKEHSNSFCQEWWSLALGVVPSFTPVLFPYQNHTYGRDMLLSKASSCAFKSLPSLPGESSWCPIPCGDMLLFTCWSFSRTLLSFLLRNALLE